MTRVKTALGLMIGAVLLATLASCPPNQLDRDGGTGNVRKGDATVDAGNFVEKWSTTNVTLPARDL